MTEHRTIPGTNVFGGALAVRGYDLNKMCFSFNDAANRNAFLADEQAYCDKYGLNAEQKAAVKARDVLGLLAAGGNVYYLAKMAGALGLNVQDLGAAQTNMTAAEFKEMLLEAAN